MKTKKNKYSNYEIPFWRGWMDADIFKREEMVKKLPFIKELTNYNKLPKKIRERSIVLILNGFFEDLESAIYTKIALEKKKTKTRNKKN